MKTRRFPMDGVFPHDSDGAARAHIRTMQPLLWRAQRSDLIALRATDPERFAYVRGDIQLATLAQLLVGDTVQARADAAMLGAGATRQDLDRARAAQRGDLSDPDDEVFEPVRAAARRIELSLTFEQSAALRGQRLITLWLGCYAECDGRRVATRPSYQPALVALGWADHPMSQDDWLWAGRGEEHTTYEA
jgi:hypothetical protein